MCACSLVFSTPLPLQTAAAFLHNLLPSPTPLKPHRQTKEREKMTKERDKRERKRKKSVQIPVQNV